MRTHIFTDMHMHVHINTYTYTYTCSAVWPLWTFPTARSRTLNTSACSPSVNLLCNACATTCIRMCICKVSVYVCVCACVCMCVSNVHVYAWVSASDHLWMRVDVSVWLRFLERSFIVKKKRPHTHTHTHTCFLEFAKTESGEQLHHVPCVQRTNPKPKPNNPKPNLNHAFSARDWEERECSDLEKGEGCGVGRQTKVLSDLGHFWLLLCVCVCVYVCVCHACSVHIMHHTDVA